MRMIALPAEKRCKKCKTWKSLDQFYRQARCKDGRQQPCRECRIENYRAKPKPKKRHSDWYPREYAKIPGFAGFLAGGK